MKKSFLFLTLLFTTLNARADWKYTCSDWSTKGQAPAAYEQVFKAACSEIVKMETQYTGGYSQALVEKCYAGGKFKLCTSPQNKAPGINGYIIADVSPQFGPCMVDVSSGRQFSHLDCNGSDFPTPAQ